MVLSNVVVDKKAMQEHEEGQQQPQPVGRFTSHTAAQ